MLTLAFLLTFSLVVTSLDLHSAFTFAGCALDACVIYIALRFARNCENVLLKALPFILVFIYLIQIYSLFLAGGFLSPLAMQNSQTAYTTTLTYYRPLIIVALCIVAYVIDMRSKRYKRMNIWGVGVPLLLFIALIPFTPKSNNFNTQVFESPLRSFANSFYTAFLSANDSSQNDLTHLTSLKRRYAYEKQNSHIQIVNKNIIIIFSEGFSARWIGPYGGLYDDLTPNLNALYKKSFVFENYYNHTAATFRGLRGQILSAFQKTGGFTPSNTGLGQIKGEIISKFGFNNPIEALKDEGYKTYFYVSQQNNLNKMLESLNFDEVFGRDKLVKKYLNGSSERSVLTDTQLFDSMLNSLIETDRRGDKFVAALYNFDTHNGLDADVRYKDFNNEVLNRFRKYDSVVGNFLEKFDQSPLSENTVLVFTTDHSTFPDIHARKADPRMPPYFIDKIPFMVYGKNITPGIYDAKYATSVAFMPTIFDLIGKRSFSNFMIGCTIFDYCAQNQLVAIGEDSFIIQDGAIQKINDDDKFASFNDLIKSSMTLSDFK